MNPLLSFGLGAYNQEAFIAEAVSGALGQTYSPLQIILSDDCSTDRTFEIMKELVGRYQGPHRVVLNQNPSNLGLARHINRIVRLAEGKLIVAASGDDVSLPERAASLFQAWDSRGRTATYVYSRMIHIDEHGKEITHPSWHDPSLPTHAVVEQSALLGDYLRTLKPGVCGSAGAYSPALFGTFGDLPSDAMHEDDAMTFRSLLMGRVLFLDTPLVKYRLHGDNMFNTKPGIAATFDSIKKEEQRLQRDFRARARMYQLFSADLLTARDRRIMSDEEFSKAIGLAKHFERLYALQDEFMSSSMLQKVSTLIRLTRAGAKPARIRKLLLRLLPGPAFRWTKLARGRLNHVLGSPPARWRAPAA
jgi:glycosyltransferase involved in cell wall biosynthesis